MTNKKELTWDRITKAVHPAATHAVIQTRFPSPLKEGVEGSASMQHWHWRRATQHYLSSA